MKIALFSRFKVLISRFSLQAFFALRKLIILREKVNQGIVSFGLFVLSSVSMKLISSSKMMVLLLILTFLATSVGNVFGYTWRVGDGGHAGSDYVADKGCYADVCNSEKLGRYDVPATNQSSGQCSLCLNFSEQSIDAVFLKRLKRTSHVSKVAVTPAGRSRIAVHKVDMVAGNLLPQPQPRVSQAILVHRTIVLRN